jgi:uncharacterized membrane protein (DUF373 family)
MTEPSGAGPQRPHPNPGLKATEEQFVVGLTRINRAAVRVLAVLMTLVILAMVGDVAWTVWRGLIEPPLFILSVGNIFNIFGAFIAVLIAIEIFINITVYLHEQLIHVQIVMATALMAIARKVIVIDFEHIEPPYIWSTAAVVLAMSVGYWLVMNNGSPKTKERGDEDAKAAEQREEAGRKSP